MNKDFLFYNCQSRAGGKRKKIIRVQIPYVEPESKRLTEVRICLKGQGL